MDTDSRSRKSPKNNDELKVYKAKIYKVFGPGDDRLQVRILPYMKDIPSDELDNLPRYPMFFKGRKITGYDEFTYGTKKADKVYVLATSDFTTGYVLGLANEFEGNGENKFTQSYNAEKVKRYISQRDVLPSDYEFNDLNVVINSMEDGTGGLIVLYNFRTGDLFAINTTGTFFTMQKDKIVMRAGSPSSDGSGAVNSSTITMTADKISFKTPIFEVDSPDVILGHSGQQLCSTNAVFGVAVDAMTFMPVDSISV